MSVIASDGKCCRFSKFQAYGKDSLAIKIKQNSLWVVTSKSYARLLKLSYIESPNDVTNRGGCATHPSTREYAVSRDKQRLPIQTPKQQEQAFQNCRPSPRKNLLMTWTTLHEIPGVTAGVYFLNMVVMLPTTGQHQETSIIAA